jgi:hypothetical protein
MSSSIAEVKEIQIRNAPSSVVVDVYKGREGSRGTYVIPGFGLPTNYFNPVTGQYIFPDPTGAENELVAQFYDWYIDLDTSSTTYLSSFQLKTNNEWEQFLKVIPNTYNTNRVLDFVSGVTSTNVVVSKNTLLLSQKFGDQSQTNNFNVYRIPSNLDTVSTVNSESAMLSLSSQSVGNYAYRTDRSQFFRLTSTPSSNIDNWQAELSINLDLDIENSIPNLPYPVISSFSLGKPTYDGDSYTFPISIIGSQLHPVNGLEAISGLRTIHISISVI